MIVFGVSHKEVRRAVWIVVDIIDFDFEYPTYPNSHFGNILQFNLSFYMASSFGSFSIDTPHLTMF